MKTKFKLLTLSASLLAAGMTLSNQAQAGAYAFSYAHIQNGFITVTNGLATLVSSSSQTNTVGTPVTMHNPSGLDITSTPDAPPATQGGTTGVFTPGNMRPNELVNDGLPPDAPLETPATTDNGYLQWGRVANSYSWADGNTRNEQFSATPGLPNNFIEIVNAAEGNIHGGSGSASSGAENSSSSTLTMLLTLPAAGTVRFDFEANPYMETFLHATSGLGSSATANLDNDLTIRAVNVPTIVAGTIVASWAPDGATNPLGGLIGGTENPDPITGARGDLESLNISINSLSAGDFANYSPSAVFSKYSATTGILPAGSYNISLVSHESQIVNKNAVPEPATLALVGLGMLGMGFASRRRKQA